MSRLKTFLLYALIIVSFYFFSNALIFLSINGSYKNIKGEVITITPTIEVKEAKATHINGYVDGNIINNTNEKIENKYVKIGIFSERDVNLGSKYVKVEALDVNQMQAFHMGYKFTESYRYEISFVDEAENVTSEQLVSDEMAGYLLLGGLLVLMFV